MSSFQCSPALHRRGEESCLPNASLERLRRAWNKAHPGHELKGDGTRKNNGKQRTGPSLLQRLQKSMKSHYKCNTEFCVVSKMPGISDSEKDTLKTYFRPEKPAEWDKKPTLWLDSFNIEDVMRQYEKADSSFEFIGPVPIDFDSKSGIWGKCIVDELCKLNIKSALAKGKKCIGIIFNLDPHDEPGSHWVAAFIDIPKSSAYYFDSYGFEPPEEIVTFMKRCKDQGIKNIYYNDIRHQRKGSECGMYSLFCIICLLRGCSFYDICKNVIDDNTMNSLRDVIYAEENPRREAIDKVLNLSITL